MNNKHIGNHCLDCDVTNGHCTNEDIYKHSCIVNDSNRLPDSRIDYGNKNFITIKNNNNNCSIW